MHVRSGTWAAVAGVVGLVGLVVAVGVGAGAATPHSVGSFRWSDAVAASRTSRVLTVAADVEGHDDALGCTPETVPHVEESPKRVVVQVEIVNHPLPPNTGCGAPAYASLPATVRLRAPLGSRPLVDGVDGRAHPVLVVDEAPAIAAVPAPFTRRATGWDERTGLVRTWWRWQARGEAAQIDLDSGPASAFAGYPAPTGSAVEVRGAKARLERRGGIGEVDTTIAWTTAAGRSFRLELLDQTAHPMAADAVLALARAVTDP